MTPDEQRLAALWPFVRAHLPPPPAAVLEIGCGPLGGFVPMLRTAGYDATGVDPDAPEGPGYHRVEFERYVPPRPVDVMVACTSLHHVADLGRALDLAAAAMTEAGVFVVVEWAREQFDEPTARWCFGRLPECEDDHGLHRRRAQWLASGEPWDAYRESWAREEGIHTGADILRELDARFVRRHCAYGPYFWSDLDATSQADEQAAIDAGQIQATGIEYVAGRAGGPPQPA